MSLLLKILGWSGLAIALLNASIKLFGADAAVTRLAGSSRNLDSDFSIAGACLIFLALAAVLDRLDTIRERDE